MGSDTYSVWVGCTSMALYHAEQFTEPQGPVIVLVPFREEVLEELWDESTLRVVDATVRPVLY